MHKIVLGEEILMEDAGCDTGGVQSVSKRRAPGK